MRALLAALAVLAPLAAAADDADQPLPRGAVLPSTTLQFRQDGLVAPPSGTLAVSAGALLLPAAGALMFPPPHTLVFVVLEIGGGPRALEVKESKTEVRLELAADVLFDFDKADLRPAALSVLQEVGAFVREKAKGAVRIEGHTDAKGSDAYNQKLSERRAASVKEWLVKNAGAKGVTYQTQGFGAKKPVAPNTKPDGSDDPAGRQKNRRVELVIRR